MPNQICQPNDKPVSQQDLNGLRKMLDSLWSQLGIDFEFTQHFLDRVNDPRNKQQITVCELQRLFSQSYERYKGTFEKFAHKFKNLDGLLSDLKTKINAPFSLRWTPATHHLELVVKTVMRTPHFHAHPGQQQFVVAHQLIPFREWLEENYLYGDYQETLDEYLYGSCWTFAIALSRTKDWKLGWFIGPAGPKNRAMRPFHGVVITPQGHLVDASGVTTENKIKKLFQRRHSIKFEPVNEKQMMEIAGVDEDEINAAQEFIEDWKTHHPLTEAAEPWDFYRLDPHTF